jgi:cell division protein FtsB
MDSILKPLGEKLVEQAEPTVVVLTFVIVLLSYLLFKSLHRQDQQTQQISKMASTLARLAELINGLVYGRKKE